MNLHFKLIYCISFCIRFLSWKKPSHRSLWINSRSFFFSPSPFPQHHHHFWPLGWIPFWTDSFASQQRELLETAACTKYNVHLLFTTNELCWVPSMVGAVTFNWGRMVNLLFMALHFSHIHKNNDHHFTGGMSRRDLQATLRQPFAVLLLKVDIALPELLFLIPNYWKHTTSSPITPFLPSHKFHPPRCPSFQNLRDRFSDLLS